MLRWREYCVLSLSYNLVKYSLSQDIYAESLDDFLIKIHMPVREVQLKSMKYKTS